MKKVLLSLVIFMSTTAFAQVFDVASIQKVDAPNIGGLVAGISPKGDYVLLTSDQYSGLMKYDLISGKSEVLSNAVGAGLNVQFSADGNEVMYREDKFVNKLRRSSVLHKNLKTGALTQVATNCRNLNGMSLQGGKAMAVVNGELAAVKSVAAGAKTLASAKSLKPIASTCNGNLVMTVNGVSNIISPNGKQYTYIWSSVSPDGKKVCYYIGGLGCFVCDINGKNVKSMGNLLAPQWYDNSTLVGFNSTDDGHTATSGCIVAQSISGARQVLTQDTMIAIFPYASAEGKKIAFSDINGATYIINIK